MRYEKDSQPIELSHEDRLSAMEERLDRITRERDDLAAYVRRLARKVGLDVPNDL